MTLREMLVNYAAAKTPEGLEAIAYVLLAAADNDTLFELACDANPAVRLALAEALFLTEEVAEGDQFVFNSQNYPLFEFYAHNCGNEKTSADVARIIMELVDAAPDRKEEITTLVNIYKDICSLYEEEAEIFDPLFSNDEEEWIVGCTS